MGKEGGVNRELKKDGQALEKNFGQRGIRVLLFVVLRLGLLELYFF